MLVQKYRPFDLDKIIGQKAIVNNLKNASFSKTIPEVIILEGLTGSGKTTIARIIAGIINCKNPTTKIDNEKISFLSPCGECASCIDIMQEKFRRDVSTLDASKMGKEDVLNIFKLVIPAPLYDKNKVIIIDEAQELSKAGKGATLQLLEKVRKNVYFILCTMDRNALDQAIKSRGHVYNFNGINAFAIDQYLGDILKAENLFETVPEEFIMEGIKTISNASLGNLRVAMQYLEKCTLSRCYTVAEMRKELGIVPPSVSADLTAKLLKKDVDFLKNIYELDIEHFYYYSWTILVDSYIYSITQKVPSGEQWKEKVLKFISKDPNLSTLLHIYNDIAKDFTRASRPIYKRSIFLAKIIDYYHLNNQEKSEKMVRKIKP
jgi:DNA polymerase-3 subunit gamma/tau